MRLHLADIHRHRVRLFRDKEELQRGRALIEQCGYWRRKQELEDAEEAAKHRFPASPTDGRQTCRLPSLIKPPKVERTMASEVFQASRWTKGNFLFPTIIEVNDRAVTRRKRSFFSRDEMSIALAKVASVHIKTGLIWSDILIESSGGTDPLASHGHTKGDARRIRELIETYQATDTGRSSGYAPDRIERDA